MSKIVAEITRADFPNAVTLVGRCTETGCAATEESVTRPERDRAIAYLRGWWEPHVLTTGHRVVIEEEE
jgi:hypothetical protein